MRNQFILTTDVFNEGNGAVLTQLIKGEEKVVAFYSLLYSKTEKLFNDRKRILSIYEDFSIF